MDGVHAATAHHDLNLVVVSVLMAALASYTTLTLSIPADLKSGVYAVKLTSGDAEEYTPFFVRPATPTAKLCLLIPTASYLAYANVGPAFDGGANLRYARPLG